MATNTVKEQRQLSGMYFRAKVNEVWCPVCFEDMTEEEQDKILESKDVEFIKGMVKVLANTLNRIGEQLDITCNPEN